MYQSHRRCGDIDDTNPANCTRPLAAAPRRRRLELRHRSSCCQTNSASNAACNDATGGVDGESLEVEINPDHATDIRETTTHEMKTPRRTIAAPTNHEMDDDTEKTIAEDWPR